jgi:MFS family permease
LQQRLQFSETVTALRGAMESLRAFGAVFQNRRLRRLQLAGAGSTLGGWAYGVALAVYAYHAGGAGAVGLVYFARFAAAAAFAPWLAVLVDRFPRRRVMVVSDLTRCVLVAAMAVVSATADSVWSILGFAILASIVSTMFGPAQAALMPSLVDTPEELTASNAVMNTIASVGMFLGPALAGALVATTSVSVVFAVTSGTFLWSALCLAGVPGDTRPTVEEPQSIGAELLAGVHAIVRVPALRVVVGLTSAQTLVAGVFEVLLVVYAFNLLHGGNGAVGWLNAAVGIGGILGVVAVAALTGRRRLAGDLGLGVILWGGPIAVAAIWPSSLALGLVLFGIIGLANTIVDVAGMTLLQRSADNEVLGRVFGIMESLILGTIALGALVAPALVSVLGARGALLATGIFLPALLVPLWPALKRVDAAGRIAREALELLRALPIFSPLPPPQIERLANAAAEVLVGAGATVFAQGDPGDRFYVIAEGEAVVLVDGVEQNRLAQGDFFGEIALLRDVPRTATVVAASPLRLYALESDTFIGAVTGYAPSREAAEGVIAARLPAAV